MTKEIEMIEMIYINKDYESKRKSVIYVDISKLDKLELLRKLYERQVEKNFKECWTYRPIPFDEEMAKNKIEEGYIEEFCGVPIHCNLRDEFVNVGKYNKSCEKNAFENVVRKMYKRINI